MLRKSKISFKEHKFISLNIDKTIGKNMQQTYIGGKKREDFTDLEDLFKGVEEFMGYVPNAHLTMAEKPKLYWLFLTWL